MFGKLFKSKRSSKSTQTDSSEYVAFLDVKNVENRLKKTISEHNLREPIQVIEVLSKLGSEEGLKFFSDLVRGKIPNAAVRWQFLLEELDAAQHGSDLAKSFVRNSRVSSSFYDGALDRSWPEVDGEDGPQQELLRLAMQIQGDADFMVGLRTGIAQAILMDDINLKSHRVRNIRLSDGALTSSEIEEYIAKPVQANEAPAIDQSKLLDRKFMRRVEDAGMGRALGQLVESYAHSGDRVALEWLMAACIAMLSGSPNLTVRERALRDLKKWTGLGMIHNVDGAKLNFANTCAKLAGVLAERDDWRFSAENVQLWQTAIEVANEIVADGSSSAAEKQQAAGIVKSSLEIVGDLSQDDIDSLS